MQKGNAMPKFFIDKNQITEKQARILGSDAIHITKVLRLSQGDTLTLCDGAGTDYTARICTATQDEVVLDIQDSSPCLAEPKLSVTLFQGLPKQGKMDYIIEKCTELGISRIVPVSFHRCVVSVKDDKAEKKKLARWRKIAAESVKQCGRGIIPEITGVMTPREAVEFSKSLDLTIAAYENERDVPLKTVLESHTPNSVGILIGPEGGFEADEIRLFAENGIPSVTLGRRILRTETAGCAVLTAVMYAFDELN